MNKELQIINQQEILGKDFKIYGTKENPLFLAKDVAYWLEERDGYTVARKVDDDEKVIHKLCVSGQNREFTFLTEDGLYEAFMQSKKPIAKAFKKEVKKVLKQIRQTGGYVSNDDMFINTYLPFADDTTKAMFKSTLETVRKQNELIQQQQKTLNTFEAAEDSILVRQLAKVMSKQGITIGEKELWKKLREWKLVNSKNEPYQRYIDMGIFEIKEGVKNSHTYRTSRITGKGQVYIIKKYKGMITL
ncbi:MAG: phage antirepressor KilAC domain-containing protein [Clostridiaceae bacterium]|nr:phage antirepressor KilAC domain-containing protein [Clostridiaceae bacterium]